MNRPVLIVSAKEKLAELECAQAALKAAEESYALAKGVRGSSDKVVNAGVIRVTVNGQNVDVAGIDGDYYSHRIIRGREMIHLGVLKALDANVDRARERVARARAALAAEVSP